MRVMLVVEPGIDGVFRHVESIVHGLLQVEIPVALAYSSQRGSDRLEKLVKLVSRSSSGDSVDLKTGNSPTSRDILAAARLARFAMCWKPHLIHAHSSKAGALVRGLGKLGILNGYLFYTPNAYYGMNTPSGLRRTVFNGVERALLGAGISINVSRDELQFASSGLGQRRSQRVLIHNSVDFEKFIPVVRLEKRRLREQWGIPVGSVVIGSVGRLSWQKDPVSLVKAFARAREQDPRLFLLILGQGELSDAVESAVDKFEVRDAYMRLEYASEPQPIYQMMDIFGLASRYEGLAFSVLEALACDLPVVLTDVPGNRAFQGLDIPGMVIARADCVDAMATCILIAVNSLNGRNECGVRDRARKFFGSRDAFARLHQLYTSRFSRSYPVI